MKLTKEQETVCRVFSRRDKTGHVHCHDWNGSPYPALGEYEGEKDGTD